MTQVDNTFERPSPVQAELRRRKLQRWGWALFGLGVFASLVYWKYLAQIPVDYESDADHFKYGSIGSDGEDGVPLAIWRALPEMFPEYLPENGAQYLRIPREERTHLDGYASMGFLRQEGHSLPVGFSQRRVLVDRVGLNCAACHVSTIRVADGMSPDRLYPTESGLSPELVQSRDLRQADSQTSRITSALIYGMPANTVDLEAYFVFLFRCAEDPRFTPDNLIAGANSIKKLGPVEKLILRQGVPRLREMLLTRKGQLHYLGLLPHAASEPQIPRFGPGRVDTFSPYKSIQFGFPFDGSYGIADYPSIWNQRPREGMHLHWDGNNSSVFERNISASLGAGATPVSLDMHRMVRVARWLGAPDPPHPDYQRPGQAATSSATDRHPHPGEMPIPQFPFPIDETLVDRGRLLYFEYCASCHDWNGKSVGTVVSLAKIGTDPARLNSYSEEFVMNQRTLGADQWWRFRSFQKTDGYANSPLDGVWARAPYLHNGSVPSLSDLFLKPCQSESDYKLVGLVPGTDLGELAKDPTKVRQIIKQSRENGYRPPVFYRGDDRYDPRLLGFHIEGVDSPAGPSRVLESGRQLYFYSTVKATPSGFESLLGNGHQGHYGPEFGTELTPPEQAALLEFMKTLGRRDTLPSPNIAREVKE